MELHCCIDIIDSLFNSTAYRVGGRSRPRHADIVARVSLSHVDVTCRALSCFDIYEVKYFIVRRYLYYALLQRRGGLGLQERAIRGNQHAAYAALKW